jgi:hypothetical protein
LLASRGEQLIRFVDFIQREHMRKKSRKIDAASFHEPHETLHARFAAGTKRGHDGLVSEPGSEGLDGNVQVT